MDKKVNKEFSEFMYGKLLEKTNKRLFVIVIILIVALIGTNLGWLYYESQFVEEKTVIEAEQEADSNSKNIIIGGDYVDKAESDSY